MKKRSSSLITTMMLLLAIFGSFMIASAEMGNAAGQTDYLTRSILKQIVIVGIGCIFYIIAFNMRPLNYPLSVFKLGYFAIIVLLLIPRLYAPVNGAYAWIRLFGFTFQPSEIAKVYAILLGAKLIGNDHKENNYKIFKQYILSVGILFGVIAFIQHDLGTSIVLLGIVFFILLITYYKGLALFHNILMGLLIIGIAIVIIIMSPGVTEFLSKYSGNYQIARIVSSANPFVDQYNTGYHLVMSLVSFATGGFLGVGYGKSIHKYMNFPNPSTDFILPVIVEETGILGFAIICCLYIGIMVILASRSLKTKKMRNRIIYLGTFMYFFIHFLFNVGGVSGLIPLTGVPLLMISSGGSSTIMAMTALGFCQSTFKYEEELCE